MERGEKEGWQNRKFDREREGVRKVAGGEGERGAEMEGEREGYK